MSICFGTLCYFFASKPYSPRPTTHEIEARVASIEITPRYQFPLFKAPFVLPAEAQSNPVPCLASLAPATVVHGSGNQFLTAIGNGFIPGAVVLWKGVARTTPYLDATHLQSDVSAADVASSQTISTTVQNPGSATSSAVALTIR